MVSQKQINALKYLINQSKDANNLTKKVCFFLLDKSNFLTEEVCIYVTTSKGFTEPETRQVSKGVHDMQSAQLSTQLN